MKSSCKKLKKSEIKDLVYKVNGAAIEVHKTLGAGLLESTYHKCLKMELSLRKINFSSEHPVSINYKGLEVNEDLRCDLLVENILPVELKSVDAIHPIHLAQLLTYMRLLECPLGLLINFNCTSIFHQGQKTLVND